MLLIEAADKYPIILVLILMPQHFLNQSFIGGYDRQGTLVVVVVVVGT